MNRLAIASVLALSAAAATAVHAASFVDTARVRSVEPQYETVAVPRTECRSRWIQEGRHFGDRGYGYRAIDGGRHDRRDEAQEIRRCWTVNDVQPRLTGYRVGYDYRGQSYTTVMRHNPGPVLQVRVSVEPLH